MKPLPDNANLFTVVKRYIPLEDFREALGHAPPGIIDKRSREAFHATKPDGMGMLLSICGMGRSICRLIVAAHGGRVWATTNAPRGAIFQFALPARRESVS